MDPERRRRLARHSKAELIEEIERLEGTVAPLAAAADGERMLRAILDTAPMMVSVKDREGRYLHVNQALAERFSLSPEEVIGKKIEDVASPTTAEVVIRNDREVYETGRTVPLHEETYHFGETERLVRVSKVPYHGPDGEIEGILSVAVDVTEQRESEARLRTLLDAAPLPIYFKDRDLRFIVANNRYLEVYGVTQDAVIGHTSEEVFAGAMGRAFLAHDQKVIAERRVVEREETIFGVPHVTTKFPVIDADGRVIGLGGIETDVSRLKEAHQELLAAKEQAELANRAKTEFLANMSHELRTPLNSVIGFAQLIQSALPTGTEGERIGDYASDIARSGTHLLELIDDILDVSRIEIGAFSLETEELDLADLIASSVRMLAVRAPYPEVNVRFEPLAEPITVRADELRLRQVLLNLLTNAVKFTPKGEIVVTAARSADGGVDVAVRDTGVGIPPEDMRRVLDPFTRSGGAMTRSREGVGLGLWLARQLMERHGGRLDLESEPGRGTTVTLRLPPERVV